MINLNDQISSIGENDMQVIKRTGTEVVFDISKIIAAITKAYEATEQEKLAQLKAEERENYSKYVRIMAELDWPAFLEYDPDFHNKIIECVDALDEQGIENAIFEHFDTLFLKDLQNRCAYSEVIKKERVPLIKEAHRLYKNGCYYGPVAILITQIAGFVADIEDYMKMVGRSFNEKNVRLLDSRYKVSKGNEKGRLIKTLLEAKDANDEVGEYNYLIGYLRMIVFGNQLEDEELQHNVNRNMVCHGTQTNYGTKEQALKIILCIDSLETVADILSEVDDGAEECEE